MGFWNLLGFGKRKETNKECALEAINTVEIQNEMLRRTGFYRMYEDGGVIDELLLASNGYYKPDI